MNSLEIIQNWFEKYQEDCIHYVNYDICKALLETGTYRCDTENSAFLVSRRKGSLELSCLVVNHKNKTATMFYVGENNDEGQLYMKNDKDVKFVFEPEKEPPEKLINIVKDGDIIKTCFDLENIQLMIDSEEEKLHCIRNGTSFITYRQITGEKRHMHVVIFYGISDPVVLDVETIDGKVAKVKHIGGTVIVYRK